MNTMPSFLIIVILYASTMSCKPKGSEQRQDEETRQKVVADSIEHREKRGKYLVRNVAGCLYCHSKRDYAFFSGPIIGGTEGMGGQKFDKYFRSVPGEVYSRNITPAGVRNWSNEALIRAMTGGVSQNGDTLYPVMPYTHFGKMSKDDALSIIAYLRTLTSIQYEVPKRKLQIPIREVVPYLPTTALEQNTKPAYADRETYGEYLVNMAACLDCHTPMKKNNLLLDLAYSGGQEFRVNAFIVRSANITPDSTTGIGTWTQEVFLAKFTQYRSADGYQYNPGKNNSVMPWTTFAGMDDFDLKAMYAYLRTLKPVNNKVVKNPL